MEMDSKEWLRTQFQENSEESVQLSVVHSMMMERFPGLSISVTNISRLVRDVFQNVSMKRLGKKRVSCIVGIELRQPLSLDSTTDSSSRPFSTGTATPTVPSSLTTAISLTSPTTTTSLPSPSSLSKDTQIADLLLELQIERDRRAALEIELDKRSEVQSAADYRVSLCAEIDDAVCSRQMLLHGPDTVEHFEQFSMSAVIAELQSSCPEMYKLVQQLGSTQRNARDGSLPDEELKGVMAICTLLNARSARVKGLQLMVSLMLVARATGRQAMTLLNHAGVCMSYNATWDHLLALTQQANLLSKIQGGNWIWAYDNLNIHRSTRHERQDYHSEMLNVTSRLAIEIRHIPDGVDWFDQCPQGSRSQLTVADILPGTDDALALQQRALVFLQYFLTSEFDDLHELQSLVPATHTSGPVQKTEVVPMRILFRDEKYVAENVAILGDLVKDANLTGSDQVVVGDQMTCKNIRSARALMQPEVDPIKQLNWVHEVPGDFHFMWECLRIILSCYWGNASTPGSLYHLREIVRRHQVDQKGKVFSIADEFIQNCFHAHLLANICQQLQISCPSDPIPHESTQEWLCSTAELILQGSIMPAESMDPQYSMHRSFLYTTFLYHDLREAVRYEEGSHVIRQWRFWLPIFLGTKCHNYATEAVNLIANIKADFPKHIAHIATHNRTVNTSGKPGHGKPIDQMVEHYNLIVKEGVQAAGANATKKHIEEISLCGMFLLEAGKKADSAFNVPPASTHHNVRDAKTDILTMMQDLLAKAAVEERDRHGSPFADPTTRGMEDKAAKGWIERVLQRDSMYEEEDEDQ